MASHDDVNGHEKSVDTLHVLVPVPNEQHERSPPTIAPSSSAEDKNGERSRRDAPSESQQVRLLNRVVD